MIVQTESIRYLFWLLSTTNSSCAVSSCGICAIPCYVAKWVSDIVPTVSHSNYSVQDGEHETTCSLTLADHEI